MVLTECMVLICKNLNSLQQVWLKLAQCILRIFLNFINVFSLFLYYLPLEKDGTIHLNNLNPLYPRMFRAKFDWNWPSGSGEEDFKNFVNVFLLFLYQLPSKKGRSLQTFKKIESPSPEDALCQVWLKLVQWLWRRSWKCEKFTDRRTDGWMDGRTTENWRSELELKSWCSVLLLPV